MRFAWTGGPLVLGLMLPALSFACEGVDVCACKTAQATVAPAAKKDPSACAKKADLIGSNCSYSTGVMAQRVLAEGNAYTYTGTLQASENALASHVASPFTLGPDGSIHVVANEVIEALANEGYTNARVQLEGKLLEVDDIKYLVVTTYHEASTS